MKKVGQHAVVIGASMGGLLAARALADYYEQVTVLERDALLSLGEHRKGVPQDRHIHVLLSRGLETLEGFFPGLTRELVIEGAISEDGKEVIRWFHEGGYHCLFRSGLRGLMLSRPLLEGHVRGRLMTLPKIHIVDSYDVLGLITTPDNGRVIRVRLISRQAGSAEELLDSDLVVDASGRGTRTPRWLKDLGYEPPEEQQVRVGVSYASRLYRRIPEHLYGQKGAVVPASPQNTRGGVMLAQENQQWIVTLFGYFDQKPPTDERGFIEFSRALNAPDIYHTIRDAEPLGDIIPATMPASKRRYYEHLARFPEGLLVTADAICSFNPIYGQGMTVAALEALALQECLESGTERLAQRFFKHAGTVVDIPWQIAVGNDLRIPQVEGKRTARTRFINWYISKLHVAARHDPEVAMAFHKVANLLAPPPSILHPRIALRVLRGNWRPLQTDVPIYRDTARRFASS